MKTIKNKVFFCCVLVFCLSMAIAGISTTACANGNCCECPGVGSPGYWMNHPDAWPVEEITIGGVTYSRGDAIEWMGAPVKGDKSITLFRALAAAKLNWMIGCDCCDCFIGILTLADEWFEDYPLGSGVRANACQWQCGGEGYYYWLDLYNNGNLCSCAPSRDTLE